MSENGLKFKRGDVLFSEGDPVDSIYIIQSGRVSLQILRSGKKNEIFQVGASQVLGDEGILSGGKFQFTAEALSPVQAVKVPLAVLKKQIESSTAGNRVLFKSLLDEVKRLRQQVRSSKMENEPVPCPEKLIPRVFGSIGIVGQYLGEVIEDKEKALSIKLNQDSKSIPWSRMKLYCTRFFMESHQRVLNALQLLANLDYVELFYSQNEEGEDELETVYFHKINEIEAFADFYQYHLFKPGRSEIIVPEKISTQGAQAIVELSEGLEPDFRGVSRLEYTNFLDTVKKRYRYDFNNTYLNTLERKGLFLQRKNTDSGVFLEFNRTDFVDTYRYWLILEQIVKWNESGVVPIKETTTEALDSEEGLCPDCRGEITEEQKFCANCGYKLSA